MQVERIKNVKKRQNMGMCQDARGLANARSKSCMASHARTHQDTTNDLVDFTLASLIHSAVATEYANESKPYGDSLKDDTVM